MQTLFERSGGFPKVSKIVSRFYDRVLDDPQLAPFFGGVDMKRQIDHQTKFIASVMGGPVSYTNEHLERVHARLDITEPAFIEVIELLRETMEDFDFEEEDIQHVADDLISRKNHIIKGK